MFETREILVENLLLDPNNPRLRDSCVLDCYVEDAKVLKGQEQLFDKIKENVTKKGDPWLLKELISSILNIGFHPIDRMVVKKLPDTQKYVVLEGNRRLSSLMILKEDLDKEKSTYKCDDDQIRATLERIEVLVLDTNDLSESEVRQRIDQILGIRHHGALLEWEPLPSAYSAYKEYLRCLRDIEGENSSGEFTFNTKALKKVSQLLAIKSAKVQNKLRAYIAFIQAKTEDNNVKDRYFSLIEALVTNSKITTGYLKVSEGSFRLRDESLERLGRLCQFGERSSLPKENLILSKPQDVSKLAKIVSARTGGRTEVNLRAEALLEELEQHEIEGDKGKPAVTKAAELLGSLVNSLEWIETLKRYMAEADKKLVVDDYMGTGNEKGRKDELKNLVKRMQVLAELDAD